MSKIIFFILLLIKFASTENTNGLKTEEIIYPSVLSLINNGLIVIQKDGIHFFGSNQVEEDSKKIKFEAPILSKEENDKIAMCQFPEKEGGYILIFAKEKIYILQKDGNILKIMNLQEMNNVVNIKLISYKEKSNYMFYFMSYKNKNSKNNFGINFYKFDLINKTNLLISNKIIEPIKNKINSKSKNNDLFGENCLLMKNNELEEDIISCFFGVGFPSEIQSKTFSFKNELLEEKENYKYLIGNYEIANFNFISSITNLDKDKAIIYFTKNNFLYQINFDLKKGFSNPSLVPSEVDLPEEYWQKESEKYQKSKESIFSSRLYRAFCKSYLIFFNSNFSETNSGFISHDNNCASLLSYSQFFKKSNYSLTLDNINNNKIFIRKRRKLDLTTNSIPLECDPREDIGYTLESIKYGLCKKCNTDIDYYKVLDPNSTLYDNGQGFVKCLNNATKGHFYLDRTDPLNPIYKPCYETCSQCDEKGDAYNHKCINCALKYRKIKNVTDNIGNCEADCPFADYYEYFLGYYQCTETNSCPETAPYFLDTPDLRRCFKDCEKSPGYNWSYAGKCYQNCSMANAEEDYVKHTCKDPAPTATKRCFSSINNINSKNFMTSGGVKSYAQTYAKDFPDTTNHVNYYSNSEAVMVIYKDQTCIKELNLTVPEIDFTECKNKIIEHYREKTSNFNENTDLIIALVGGETVSSGIETSYSFFYKNGDYINVTEICSGIKFDIKNEIDTAKIHDDAEIIASQGINIFDLDHPFYTDICFMYDSPTGRDATPNDRLKTYFPNISLCDEESGCSPKSVNLTTFEVICNCELNDIMSNSKVGEKILEDGFGDILEFIEESNIQIFKCAKDVFVFKHLEKNSGTYITLGIMLAQILCFVVYYLISYNPMLRYLYYLSECQCSIIEQKLSNKANNKNRDSILNSKLIKIKAPPKKEEKRGSKTPTADKLISSEDSKQPKKLDITGSNSNINLNKRLPKIKNEGAEKVLLKPTEKKDKKPMYADKLKEEYDIDMEEYLKTDYDEMEFEDILKKDKRTFCEYYCERFKETQIIMDTFFNPEYLKPMTIKIILLLLNIILYFVINGLFYSEEYVSDLFNSDEKEKFFSFFPRSLSRFFYTTFVGVIIGFIVDFIAVDEKKVKRLFLREKRNTLQIRYEISQITTDIKRNYLILMIICLIIDLISFYYVNCFNNVYPNLQKEWIKSSICVIIIIQLLSMLIALFEAVIRLIAFKCKSERVYKIKDIFD